MANNKKKILVIGSGGFVLGNFVRQAFYEKKPYSISSIDRVRDSNILHNIYVNLDHAFYIADIRDPHILHVIFQKVNPDIVVHGAEEKSSSTDILSSNINGLQNVINECLNCNSKLIYLSTDKIYGDISENDKPNSENSPYNPYDIFTVSKVSAELLIKTNKNLKYNIVRLSNNYGQWQSKDFLIPNIIRNILDEKPIIIYGDGRNIRDWTHVNDSCSALFEIIDKGVDGEIYNITSKQEYYNIEIFKIICDTLNKKHDLISFVENKDKENLKRCSMTNDKIVSLGWNPKFKKFKDGIKPVCQWYISNQYILKN